MKPCVPVIPEDIVKKHPNDGDHRGHGDHFPYSEKEEVILHGKYTSVV
jgi:hypothetical protein